MMTAKKLAMTLCVGLTVMTLGACKQEGPAERTGRKIDEAAKNLGEAVEKKGPLERAGESMDKAVEDAGEAVEEAGDRAKEATE